ncbi:gamma-glutamyltransferase family protein [Terrisporobacter petrolearius]|uniref:gamma-glutamyltransferase family protein n=1 Tax=Terrisporobacter petrolearius TaxID=1460447 RepID=UPI0031CC9BD5
MSKKYSKNKKMKTKKKRMKTLKVLAIFILIISIVGGFYIKKNVLNNNSLSKINSKYSYSISTSNELATQVGEEILAKGGNAVDAAIAVAYALGVVEPYGSGIGGGGGMLIYNPSADEYKFYDYKDVAPLSQSTKKSNVGVPGFVAGMEKVFKDYGSMEFKDLIQPSINLAKNGFKVDEELEKVINVYSATLMNNSAYVNNGQLIKQGENLVQQDLAETLEYIKSNGAKGFYEDIIATNVSKKSVLTADDMKSYKVDVVEPISGEFNGYNVVSAPAPFSGATLIQTIEIIEQLGKDKDLKDANNYLDALNTATDLSTYERVKKIGDPDFANIDYKTMTSEENIKSLINMGNVKYQDDEESESTTHFSIVDKNGMVVSSTNTLGHFFGSETLVDGFYLNGTMSNFGKSGINKYAPGKKPRTFTSPTIVKKGDDFTLAIGTPGGNRIVKVLAPILVDKLYFEKDLQESINKNRVTFYSKGTILAEDNENRESIIDISTTKYPVIKSTDKLYFGAVQAAGIENGKYIGASDIRRPGKVSISNK